MSATDEMLANAEAYAATFDKGDLPAPPARRVTIVGCMDARIDLYRLFGLQEGEAHVIRNAGGVVCDETLRSLAISQHVLGTQEVVLLHHTRCGMLGFDPDEFADRLERETGRRPEWPRHTIHDLEESMRDSIRRVRESPFIPRKHSVRGFVYDVETGRLSEIEA